VRIIRNYASEGRWYTFRTQSTQESNRHVKRQRTQRHKREKKQVLKYKRLGLQERCVGRAPAAVREGEFLDARPGEVYVEEEEQDAEAEDGAVEGRGGGGEAVEEEVAVDLGGWAC
jgi:hypothetical protein